MILQRLDTTLSHIGDEFCGHREGVRLGERSAGNQRSRLIGTERTVRRGNRGQHHLNATVGTKPPTVSVEEPVNELSPQSAFLAAFSLHPAGVAVITARDAAGQPVGFTATSLASFSAFPPRASFNIARHASSYPAVAVGSSVILHFLAEHQVDLARTMAASADQRFVGDHWAPDSTGLPRLAGVRAVLNAHVVAVTEVGENASVVVEIDGGDTNTECSPLVYVERRYHAVGDTVD